MVDAVLPAAGLLRQRGQEPVVKALLDVNGSPLVQRAVSALRNSGMVDRIVVIGPREVQQHALAAGADAALNTVGGGAENVLAGLEWLTANVQSPLPVAIMACDLPFVDDQALRLLLQNLHCRADVVVPLVRREDFLIRFPGAPAAFVRLMEGSFALTGVYIVNPLVVLRESATLCQLFRSRKSQWKTARMVGLSCALRLMRGTLSLGEITSVIQRVFGCSALAHVGVDPSLAFDIDDIEDLAWCRNTDMVKDGSTSP